MTDAEVVIDRRFRGPPSSGNGGYCAGLLAGLLDGAVEVTLRSPPPLDRALQVEHSHDAAVLRAGDDVIASARVSRLTLVPPPAPSFEAAQACVARFTGWKAHLFPQCFVCGPAREEGDGLRIFPGPTADGQAVAAPWIPDASLVSSASNPPSIALPSSMVWAALDCPGYFAAARGEDALLGRMSAELFRVPACGERCVVVGWPLGREGRKIFAGTALYDESGALLGYAQQTWIALRPTS